METPAGVGRQKKNDIKVSTYRLLPQRVIVECPGSPEGAKSPQAVLSLVLMATLHSLDWVLKAPTGPSQGTALFMCSPTPRL